MAPGGPDKAYQDALREVSAAVAAARKVQSDWEARAGDLRIAQYFLRSSIASCVPGMVFGIVGTVLSMWSSDCGCDPNHFALLVLAAVLLVVCVVIVVVCLSMAYGFICRVFAWVFYPDISILESPGETASVRPGSVSSGSPAPQQPTAPKAKQHVGSKVPAVAGGTAGQPRSRKKGLGTDRGNVGAKRVAFLSPPSLDELAEAAAGDMVRLGKPICRYLDRLHLEVTSKRKRNLAAKGLAKKGYLNSGTSDDDKDRENFYAVRTRDMWADDFDPGEHAWDELGDSWADYEPDPEEELARAATKGNKRWEAPMPNSPTVSEKDMDRVLKIMGLRGDGTAAEFAGTCVPVRVKRAGKGHALFLSKMHIRGKGGEQFERYFVETRDGARKFGRLEVMPIDNYVDMYKDGRDMEDKTVFVPKNAGDTNNVKYFSEGELGDLPPGDYECVVLGFDDATDGKTMLKVSPGTMHQYKTGRVTHNASTTWGWSGGVGFAKYNGKLIVAFLHNGAKGTGNFGVKVMLHIPKLGPWPTKDELTEQKNSRVVDLRGEIQAMVESAIKKAESQSADKPRCHYGVNCPIAKRVAFHADKYLHEGKSQCRGGTACKLGNRYPKHNEEYAHDNPPQEAPNGRSSASTSATKTDIAPNPSTAE
jgi:hypothetical protein